MDLRDTPEEAQFRAEPARLDRREPARGQARRARRRAAVRRPVHARVEPQALRGRLRRADVAEGVRRRGRAVQPSRRCSTRSWPPRRLPPHVGVIGLGMAGPTIIAHGTRSRRRATSQPILSAEEIWCQGFSEPDAGSDLAAARTRAERRGDVYVVNGQKVWSSFAHIADFCILVTQSDPDAAALPEPHIPDRRHARARRRGAAARQITGEAEFNEIFFSDVEVPVENRLGDEGDGWQVAMTTLLHERGTLGFALTATLDGASTGCSKRRASANRRRHRARGDRAGMDRAAGAALHELPRARRRYERTGIPGPEGSGVKLRWSETNQRLTKLARELRGPGGILDDGWWNHQQLRSAATRSRPARRKSSATSSPSACSGFRRAGMDFASTTSSGSSSRQRAHGSPTSFPLDRDWDAQDDRWGELEELGWHDVAEAGPRFRRRGAAPRGAGATRCYPGLFLGHVASVPERRRRRTVDPTRRCNEVEETPRLRAAGRPRRSASRSAHSTSASNTRRPRTVRQADRHVPGRLPSTRADVHRTSSSRARSSYWAAWCVAEDDDARRSRPPRRRRSRPRRRSPRASARSRSTAARLHVGAPPPPLLQARHLARGLRHPAVRVPPRDRRRPPRVGECAGWTG